MPKLTVERVFAEAAPRQTAWAVMEDGEAVDYRTTKVEALAAAANLRSLASRAPAEAPEQTPALLAAVREELIAAFSNDGPFPTGLSRRELREIVQKAVYLCHEAPGGWGEPNGGLVEVYTEYHVGPHEYEPGGRWLDAWQHVSEALQRRGYPVFFEAVNSAVQVLYPIRGGRR